MKSLIALVTTVLVTAAPLAHAAEKVEPGAVIVAPSGNELFVVVEESLLLDKTDVAQLDQLVTEIQACRETDCAALQEKEAARKERMKVLGIAAIVVGAFAAGVYSDRNSMDLALEFHAR